MTIFELAKIALDELYTQGREEYREDLDQKIKNSITCLHENYRQLNNVNRQPVNYRDPATRFAYAYKYVPAHGDYLVQIMERLREEAGGTIFAADGLRVSCVGGGPGSDVIAVLKYLDENKNAEPVKNLICYLLDGEQAWADTWTEICESLKSGVLLNMNFQPLDVTEPDSWRLQKNFLKADLFTMSYFVSEVFSLDKDGVVADFWSTLFTNAKPGALFIYIDNGHVDFTGYFDRLWKKAGLESLISVDGTRMVLRRSEQTSELAQHKTKFGHTSKAQSWIDYRVLRKPCR